MSLLPVNETFINGFNFGYDWQLTADAAGFNYLLYQVGGLTYQPTSTPMCQNNVWTISLQGSTLLSQYYSYYHNEEFNCGVANVMEPAYSDHYEVTFSPGGANYPCFHWMTPQSTSGYMIFELIDNPL